MQNFMNLQCKLSQIAYPRWARKWIDVRKLFSNYLGVKRCSIANMLAFYDFEFDGQQHCGLDDAKNIARILIRLAKDGCHVKVNSNLKKCLTEMEKKTNAASDSDDNERDEENEEENLDFEEEG
jgi:inhibitor of KinA sporulation pathway (predicted exonuclease)